MKDNLYVQSSTLDDIDLNCDTDNNRTNIKLSQNETDNDLLATSDSSFQNPAEVEYDKKDSDEKNSDVNNKCDSEKSTGAAENFDEDEKEESVTYPSSWRDLFRYSTKADYVYCVLGLIMCIASGAAYPLMAIFLGDAIGAFYPFDKHEIIVTVYKFLGLAVGMLITSFLGYYWLSILSARLVRRLRYQSMVSVLSQNIGWFDVTNPNEIVSKIALQTVVLEEGIGVKFVEVVKYTGQFFSGFIIGFVNGWELALMMCVCIPLLVMSMGMLRHFLVQYIQETNKLYGVAGGTAEESLGAIRTVTALNAQTRFKRAYDASVKIAEKSGIKAGRFSGLGACCVIFTIFATYALGWWFGAKLFADGNSNFQNVGDITTVFFAIMVGSMALAQIGPSLAAVFQGFASLDNIIQIIDQPSCIDVKASKKTGIRLTDGVRGNIKFNDITFRYPSRKKQTVLQNFTLDVKPGQTVALVGESGSGKSTLVSLVQRFYDPEQGSVAIDGLDIRSLDLAFIRGNIGLVSQEANLFSGTIAENIAFGLMGTPEYLDSSKTIMDVDLDEIIAAAKLSNAHNFIMAFIDGYDTLVGEKGIQLSGGQKQRIAIARAIIRKPSILLLDESTSALDSENEKIVQAALDSVVSNLGLTTIVIAHRLSTVRNADVIAVLEKGVIIEKGSHDELMNVNGTYASLIALQSSLHTALPSDDILTDDRHIIEEAIRKSSVRSYNEQSTRDTEFGKALEEQETDQLVDSTWKIVKRLWFMNRNYRMLTLQGFFFASLAGVVFPAKSLLLTQLITVLGENENNIPNLQHEVNKFSLYYLLFAIVSGLIFGMMSFSFRKGSEKAQTAIRITFFDALLKQDVGFFDRTENSSGALVNELSTNPSMIGAIVGENLGRLIQNIVTLISGIVFAFVFGSWELTLVLLVLFPLLVVVQIIQTKFLRAGNTETKGSMGESGKMATEAVNTIRTVVSYGLEDTVLASYLKNLKTAEKQNAKFGAIGGFSVAVTSFLTFAGYALCFYIGSLLVENGTTTFDRVLRSLMVIMFAALGMAQASSFMIDSNAALKAAKRLFSIIDRKPIIDVGSDEGIKHTHIKGNVTLNKVGFTYETRPDQCILRNVDIHIPTGSTCALVGESGSGKSTVISLTERFYDTVTGSISLDDKNVKDYNVNYLRSQIGYVGQEPTLFKGSIADNIVMGLIGCSDLDNTASNSFKENKTSVELVQSKINAGFDKNSLELEKSDLIQLQTYENPEFKKTMGVLPGIIEAAKMSNAHNFIMTFPDGYHTEVGVSGTQLSGGQKQRVAIARAIISNPPILLLDEATSALDAESEKVVQDALDKLMEIRKRTTIVIAHRLNTIKNADKIIVMKSGKIIEQGTHKELYDMNGYYTGLCRHQNLYE